MRAKLAAQMTTDAQALLGAAYVAAGNPKAAEPLLAAKAEPVPAPRGDDVFDSALRSRALLLAALVDAAPDAPATAQAARDLTRMLDAAPACSTQESGMAFVALGKLFARQQNLPACTGRVLSGQEEVARFDTARTTLLKSLPVAAPPRLELDAACGPGALFYSLDARGVPQPETYKPSANGLELKREFLDRAGKPLDPARITQGSPVVVKTSLRSTSGPLAHVVLSQLLPSGLEVENPRLATTEKLDWMEAKPSATAYADYRADRVNVFLDLPDQEWKDVYTLCRAVIPGTYALPPVRAEAMYAPEIAAGTALGVIGIEGSKK
uniref:Bacterial alpha-2-macroglobulin MG10 domain-containing protein n=1 Tax=Fundidesulfovibrio putealis TaxID=270496 RepID=A0A7C4AGD3_9BACT